MRSEIAYYVTYKRRDILRGGEYAIRICPYQQMYVKRIVYNGWAVPYIKILSRCFQCHINVALSKVGEIKNSLKFVCKSGDRVAVELRNNKLRYNKVSSFQDVHYILASEAVWRVVRNEYVERHPKVVRLNVHLLD